MLTLRESYEGEGRVTVVASDGDDDDNDDESLKHSKSCAVVA